MAARMEGIMGVLKGRALEARPGAREPRRAVDKMGAASVEESSK